MEIYEMAQVEGRGGGRNNEIVLYMPPIQLSSLSTCRTGTTLLYGRSLSVETAPRKAGNKSDPHTA